MTTYIKFYTLGIFMIISGLFATSQSDLFKTISFSSDKKLDAACNCTSYCTRTVTSNASFKTPADRDKISLIDLDTIEKLANDFTLEDGKVRMIALLSPTCPYCVAGFRAVRNILQQNDNLNVKVYLVWEPMLHSDNREEAEKIAAQISDDRVIQYWDETRITGKTWQEILATNGPAWDVYMLYDAGAEWDRNPGEPDFWMHQLSGVNNAPRLDEQQFKDALQNLLDSDSL